ncbi:hypothetical protein SAMN05216359_10357 [Roseateles sp. YR242]|uniref:hypothetical protein n=1 Tax=Roseateles sp. YR242 TaxID=1855305 RepID=UPI0008D17A6B|nr:hypothetical protein [Roseateles sp. YR242]SEK78169.1 hypothetical protein SAMN05216359_10357 [Roseateles sp. YR242]
MYSVNSMPPAVPLLPPSESQGPVKLKGGTHLEDIIASDQRVDLEHVSFLGKVATRSGNVKAEGSILRPRERDWPVVSTDSGSVSLTDTTVEGSVVTQRGDVRTIRARVFGDLTLTGGVRTPEGAARFPTYPTTQTAHLVESFVQGDLRCSDLLLHETTIQGCIDLDCEAPALMGDEARIVFVNSASVNEARTIHATGHALVIVHEPGRPLDICGGGQVVVLDMSPMAAYQRMTAADQLPPVDSPLYKQHWRQFQHALLTLCKLPPCQVSGVDSQSLRSTITNRAQELAQLLRVWTDKDVKGLTEKLSTLARREEFHSNLAVIGKMLLSSQRSPTIDLLIAECARLAHARGADLKFIMSRMEMMGSSPQQGGIQPPAAFGHFWEALGARESHRPPGAQCRPKSLASPSDER